MTSTQQEEELLILQSGNLLLLSIDLREPPPRPAIAAAAAASQIKPPTKVFSLLTDSHFICAKDEKSIATEPIAVIPLCGQRQICGIRHNSADPPASFTIFNEKVGTLTFGCASPASAKTWSRAIDLAISALATEAMENELETLGTRIYPEQLRILPDSRCGSGGNGVVLRGILLNRIPVAVKELRFSEEFSSPKDHESFMRECSVLSSVDHPSIVRFFGFCRTAEGRIRMVTEFVSGGDLSNYLFDPTAYPMDERKIARLSLSISEGLEFLHKKGIVHRDLKPENVLVSDWNSCAIRICDFGLSRAAERRANWTSINSTPIYSAPEFDNSGSSFALDVYSFGVLLWEMIARKEPFKECKWVSEIRTKIEKGEHPPVPEVGFSPWIKNIVEKCRAVDPKERPTFTEISGVLRGALQDIAIRTGGNADDWPPSSPLASPRQHHSRTHSGTKKQQQQYNATSAISPTDDLGSSSASDHSDPSVSEISLSNPKTTTPPSQTPPQQAETEPTTTKTHRDRFVSSADLSPLMTQNQKMRRGTDAGLSAIPDSVRNNRASSLSKSKGKISPLIGGGGGGGGSSTATEAFGNVAPTAPVHKTVPIIPLSPSSQGQAQQFPLSQQGQNTTSTVLVSPHLGTKAAAIAGGDLQTNWAFFGIAGSVSAIRLLSPTFEEVWLTELPNCKDGMVSLLVDSENATVYAGCHGRITAMSCFLGIIKWQVALQNMEGARLSMQFTKEKEQIILGGAGHVVCISKDKGQVIWDTQLPGRSTFATLVHICQSNTNEQQQKLIVGATGHLVFMDSTSGTIENIVPMNAHISFGVTISTFETSQLDSNPLIINAATNSLLCSITAAGFLTRTCSFKTPFAITQLITRDTLFLAYYHSGVKIRACHPATLRQRWRASLLTHTIGAVTTVVSLTSSEREPGAIYVGCCGWVYALDCTTGKEKAKVSLPGTHSGVTIVHAFPTCTFGGLIFASCKGTLFLIDPTTLAIVYKSQLQRSLSGSASIGSGTNSGNASGNASSNSSGAGSSGLGSGGIVTVACVNKTMDEHSSGFLLSGITKQPQIQSPIQK